MAAELTFEAICTSSRNAAALGVDRSRSLKYAGRLAQLSSSRRLLERFRLLLLGLKWYSDRSTVAVPLQVRRAESKRRGSTRGRKTFLTRIEGGKKRQDSTSLGLDPTSALSALPWGSLQNVLLEASRGSMLVALG